MKKTNVSKEEFSNFVCQYWHQRVNVYDNGGETADRYTIEIFNVYDDVSEIYTASSQPSHPQGIGMFSHTQETSYEPNDNEKLVKFDFTNNYNVFKKEVISKTSEWLFNYIERLVQDVLKEAYVIK